jgi:hypothetical protein
VRLQYVLRQAADDISLPMRMSITNEKFVENPELSALGGDAVTIDHLGRQIEYVHLPMDPKAIKAASFL